MTSEPGRYPATGGQAHLRASTADRERANDVLKAAFAEGRITRDEFEERTGQVFSSRTYADLAVLTADLPAGPFGLPPVPHPAYPVAAPARYPVAAPEARRNTLSTVAFVCAFIPGLTALAALPLGLVARRQIARSGERGAALANAAIVISLAGILLTVIFVSLNAF